MIVFYRNRVLAQYTTNENPMEFVLNRLSAENRSGHRGPQESCRVEEVSQESEVACQVSQFQSNSEGKITRKRIYIFGR